MKKRISIYLNIQFESAHWNAEFSYQQTKLLHSSSPQTHLSGAWLAWGGGPLGECKSATTCLSDPEEGIQAKARPCEQQHKNQLFSYTAINFQSLGLEICVYWPVINFQKHTTRGVCCGKDALVHGNPRCCRHKSYKHQCKTWINSGYKFIRNTRRVSQKVFGVIIDKIALTYQSIKAAC